MGRILLRASIALFLFGNALLAGASFHLWKINEVYSNAAGNIQFIEFETSFGGQEFLAGHMLTVTQGAVTNTLTFPSGLPGDTAPTNMATRKFLVGTQSFAALGLVTPDYIVPDNFLFTTNATINFAGVDFMSYASLPTSGGLSIDHFGATAINSPTNFAGLSSSVPSTSIPGAPSITAATPGNGLASIAFSPPASDGGSAITGYTATCTPGPVSNAGSTTPITVPGLANGTTYTCTVTASNAVGTGPSSAPANVTPATVPGIPGGVSVSPADGAAVISFSAPAANGSAINSYTGTCDPGNIVSTSAVSPVTIGGLTNGSAYTCRVHASNAIGAGADSSGLPVTPAGPPGPPTGLVAARGNGQATLTFGAGNDNGSPISSYAATCNPGNHVASGAGSPIVVTALTNGTAYSCSVVSNNGVGSSASASVTVVPATVPGSPLIGNAIAGNTEAWIAFTPPAGNGGSVITGYAVSCSPSGAATGNTSPIRVTGLANGVIHSCNATALNAVGPGAASANVAVTPVPSPTLALVGVVSRKSHANQPFDVQIDPAQIVTGPVSVEPRMLGTGHRVVFQFNDSVNSGTAVMADGFGTSLPDPVVSFAGNEMTALIPTLADNTRVSISIAGVNGSFGATVSLGFLVGDVTNSGAVSASDIASVKAHSNTTVTNDQAARFDINANGTIGQEDISAVKARSGKALP